MARREEREDTGLQGTSAPTRLGLCEAKRGKGDQGHRDVNRGARVYARTRTHRRDMRNGTKDVSDFHLLPEAKYPKLNASVY